MATRPELDHSPTPALLSAKRRRDESKEKIARSQNEPSMVRPERRQRERTVRSEGAARGLKGNARDFDLVEGRNDDVMGVKRWYMPKEKKAKKNVEEGRGRSDVRIPDLHIPIARARRLQTDDGRTSFHFSHDAVTKTGRQKTDEAGRVTRPGAAKAHNRYIERDEAVAAIENNDGTREGISDPRADNDNPLDQASAAKLSAAQQGTYIERQEALAVQPDGKRVLFTNIDPDPAKRAEFWELVEKHERDPDPDRMTFRIADAPEFWARVRMQPDCPNVLAEAIDSADPTKNKTIKTEDNVEMRRWLSRQEGWLEIGPRRDNEKYEDYVRRQARSFAKFHDGRGGRIQYRIIGELPHELSLAGRASILREFSKEMEKHNLPYVAVMHAPDHTNSDKNWHFHLVYYDRPAARVTEERIAQMPPDPNEKNTIVRGVDESAVGRWDFDVAEEYKTSSREIRTRFPLRQEKVREVSGNAWIPALRKRLAEITNDHLEEAGIARRLDPRRHSEMGIHSDPQEHLGTRNANLEAMGIATPAGVRNEERQWNGIVGRLENKLKIRKNGVDREAERYLQKIERSGLDAETQKDLRLKVSRWHQHKTEGEEFDVIAMQVTEHMERVLSRAQRVYETCSKQIRAIDAGKASRYQQSRHRHLLARMQDSEEYLKAATEFLADERKLVEDSRRSAETERMKAERIAIQIEQALAKSNVIDLEDAKKTRQDREAGAERKRVAANGRSAYAPLALPEMNRWIEEIRVKHRRLRRDGRRIVPATMLDTDKAIVGAPNYHVMSARLMGILKQQDELIGQIVEQIDKHPWIVTEQHGADGPIFELKSKRPILNRAFLNFADEPEIVAARTRALDSQAERAAERKVANQRRFPAPAGNEPASTPSNDRREDTRKDTIRNRRAVEDRIASRVMAEPIRVRVANGRAFLSDEALRLLEVDPADIADATIQKRLTGIASVQEREIKRLSAYVAADTSRLVDVEGRLQLSPKAPRELFEIARKWVRDEEVQASLRAMREEGGTRKRAAASPIVEPAPQSTGKPDQRAKRPAVDTGARQDRPGVSVKAPVAAPSQPTLVPLTPDEEMREAARRYAQEQERMRATTNERRDQPKPELKKGAGARRPGAIDKDLAEKLEKASAITDRAARSKGHNPLIDRWIEATETGASGEERRRLALQVANDRQAREKLREIDRALARRIREDAERAREENQLGLGLGIDQGLSPKR